jgi:sphingolipid delta-4 desaturase
MSSRTLSFRHTDAPEPHRLRRALILRAHPEVKRLFGFERRTKWRMALVLVLQIALAWTIARAGAALSFWTALAVVFAAAYLVGSILNHYGGVVIHEASHNLCARTERQNRWIAIFANLPKILPYAMTFRRHHLEHHRAMGVEGIDNDLALRLERRLIGNCVVAKLAWLMCYPIFGALCRGFLRKPDRWEITNVAVQLAFNGTIFVAIGPWGLAYLALSTWMSASLHPIAGHFIHEHYLWDEGQETYSYYGPLNALTENMGYHVEHHDFMAVPGSRLPELHRIAREFYAPLVSHRSWTRIFWTFVTDRRLSHASRIARTAPKGDGSKIPTTVWA